MKIVFFFFTLPLLTRALLFASFTEHGDAPWGCDSALAHINLSFGLSSSGSEEFTQQILGFSGEVNGQRHGARPKISRGASKLPEDEGEKPKTQVIRRKPTSELHLQKQSVGQKSCRSLIRFFQVYISPIDGPRSSFYPTSSQYALEAIQKYGVFAGIAMGCDRLMRENGELWVYERTNKYGIERKLDPVP